MTRRLHASGWLGNRLLLLPWWRSSNWWHGTHWNEARPKAYRLCEYCGWHRNRNIF